MDRNRQKRTEADRNRQTWTETYSNRQQRTAMDRDGQRQTEMDRNGHWGDRRRTLKEIAKTKTSRLNWARG